MSWFRLSGRTSAEQQEPQCGDLINHKPLLCTENKSIRDQSESAQDRFVLSDQDWTLAMTSAG